MKQPKFYFQQWKPGYYWSVKQHKMIWFDDIGFMVHQTETELCKGQCLTLKEIIEITSKRNNNEKKHRDLTMLHEVTEFPLKDNHNMTYWNGCICCDLDLIHSIFCNLDNNKRQSLYNQLIIALEDILPNNFYYIEHSSSGSGIHIYFYFDIDRTEENHHRCAAYIETIFRTRIDEYIKDFHTIFDKYTDGQRAWDDVVYRPFQKCYITGIDAYFAGGNGKINNELSEFEEEKKEYNNINLDEYEITEKKIVNKSNSTIWDCNHNKRFYIATALKAVTSNKSEWESIWFDLCEKFNLYKSYTVKGFKNEFNYDQLDINTAHLEILEPYGIKFKKKDTGSLKIELLPNEFIGDYLDRVINFTDNGICLMKAPTGTGKTKCWIDYNENLLKSWDFMNPDNQKPILVIEPLNSIIETKYDNERCCIITGSKIFKDSLGEHMMYVTNYNHIIRRNGDGSYSIRQDIDDFLKNFSIIVIDESHIIIKDSFRFNVLYQFIKSINKAKESSKIILQTATPMHEDNIFDINQNIIFEKHNKADIKFIFRNINDKKFKIQELLCITQYYVKSNRKVYIYWNNASLQQLKSFAACYLDPNKVAIYHKRGSGSIDMNRISKYHVLDTDYYNGEKDDEFEEYHYDVLLSSVYFGVGNDLDDTCDTAVIIIGNNCWQEDIQAIGRWRNSLNIEVCEVILPNEKDIIEDPEYYITFDELYNKEKYKLDRIWYDKTNRNKSIIVNNTIYPITEQEQITTYANISAAMTYNSLLSVKVKMLKEYYIRVKEHYDRPIENNAEYETQLKKYNQDVKDIRDSCIKNIVMNNEINYDIINSDTKLESWLHIYNKLKDHNLINEIGIDVISKRNNIPMLKVFLQYYLSIISKNIDYSELSALIWVRENIDEEFHMLGGIEVDHETYWTILGYLGYLHWRNADEKQEYMKYDYYRKFKYNALIMSKMGDHMIDILNEATNDNIDYDKLNDFYKEFLRENNNIIEKDNRPKKSQIKVDIDKVNFIVKRILNPNIENGKKGGKSGSPKKIIRVCDQFKHPEKYKIEVGQTFNSCTELAVYAKVSGKTVSQWISKQWIESV